MRIDGTSEFKRFFKQMPWWILPLLLILLFGRFVLVAAWHWIAAM